MPAFDLPAAHEPKMARPAADMPVADIDIDAHLVGRLVADQHAGLADLAIEPLAFGWDNATFRLGRDLLVRLPRRVEAVALLEAELRWLPQLAPQLPLPVSDALHAGRPTGEYPWPWAICRFVPGADALRTPPTAPSTPIQLASFCNALHVPAPGDAPDNPYRGQPLADRHDLTISRMTAVEDTELAQRVAAGWEEAVAVPAWGGPPIWIHGDMHPGNVIVDDRSQLAAIIDFGDITSGDPACDLMIAWALFGPSDRERFRAELTEVDDNTWTRGRGWAISHSLAVLANSANNPRYQQMAINTLTAAT